MLTEVKNQLRVMLLATKYAIMKEMLNKASFIMNVLFMVLNNASFILVWLVIFSIKDNINGYTIDTILLLWGLAAGTYGVSHAFFLGAYDLSNKIVDGKLDAYIVQPKSILIQSILGTSPSAFGDILYAYILLFITGITPVKFLLFTLFLIIGGIIQTAAVVIYNSLAFWFGKVDSIADTLSGMIDQFSTYPDTIFNKYIHILFYTLVPAGFVVILPLKVMIDFKLAYLGYLALGSLGVLIVSIIIFYKGLKKYSSSNLMIARV